MAMKELMIVCLIMYNGFGFVSLWNHSDSVVERINRVPTYNGESVEEFADKVKESQR